MRSLTLPAVFAGAFLGSMLLAATTLTTAGLGSSAAPYYERYGEALTQGQLWIEAKPSLSACSWDLSFHDGKCYLYWGILPAFVHVAMPFFSDRAVTLAMATVSVFFLLLIVQRISGQEGVLSDDSATPIASMVPVSFFLVFLTGFPASVLAARVYEESIMTGCAFGLAGIFALLSPAAHAPVARAGRSRTTVGILCLVLAGLSRSPWMLVAAALVSLLAWRQLRARTWRDGRTLAVGTGALIAGIGVQLALNATRFGNPLEFGLTTQASVAATLAAGKTTIALGFVPANIANYFFTALPPMVNPFTMPFSPFGLPFPRVTAVFTSGLSYPEFGLGLFLVMPTLLLGVPRLAHAWRRDRKTVRPLLTLSAITLPLAVPVLASAGYMYRYQFEANLFVLLLLAPLLLPPRAVDDRRDALLHAAAVCIGATIVGLNTLWVVKMVCTTWQYC